MALPPLPARLVLAGLTGLLLLGGIAGAATVDDDSDETAPREALAPNDTTPPAPDAPVEAGLAVDEAPAGIPAAPETATTATTGTPPPAVATGPTTTTAAARPARAGAPGALVAPKPGAYAYEATSTSSGGPNTERTTTTVEAAGTEGATTIQAITLPLDFGGQRATLRNTVAWSASGAVVRRSLITIAAMGQQQLDCVWQPAFAQYEGGLAVGKAWSFDTRCTAQIQGLEVTLQQKATRRVTGTAQVAGPAGTVATWTIADDTTVIVTTGPLGSVTVRSVGTQQLAPSLGLPVRSETRVESSTSGSAPQSGTVTTKLVTLA